MILKIDKWRIYTRSRRFDAAPGWAFASNHERDASDGPTRIRLHAASRFVASTIEITTSEAEHGSVSSSTGFEMVRRH